MQEIAESEDLFPPPSDSMALVRKLLDDGHVPPLRRFKGQFYAYDSDRGCYEDLDHEGGSGLLRLKINGKSYEHVKKSGVVEIREILPTTSMVTNITESLKALVAVEVDMPCWTGLNPIGATDPDPRDLIVLKNGILNRRTRRLTDHDERLFTTTGLPFEYDEDATCPDWEQFLKSIWGDDPDSVKCLQEIFGYVLSGRKDLQKAFLIHGLPRSGKGTIARVLQALVGERNHVATTMSQLATDFGCQPLIGKALTVIGDARVTRSKESITERILSISGDDVQTINRKNRDHWTGRLGVRFLILSNELPDFRDKSGAITTRFITLRTSDSHLGREDLTLEKRLAGELSGIFNWALDGMDVARFTEPASMADDYEIMLHAASPLAMFRDERCETDRDYEILTDDLWTAYLGWCVSNHCKSMIRQHFGRALSSLGVVRDRESTGQRRRIYKGIRLAVSN